MKTVLFQRVRSLLFFLSVFVVLFFSSDNAWAYSPTIAGGGEHTIALKADGTVWAWGDNEFGQLGDGTTTDSSSPVQVVDADGTGFLYLNVSVELRVDSVSPFFGTTGQDLEVTLTGAGFDENTRVSIIPDVIIKKI